jgi:hypothetical protein
VTTGGLGAPEPNGDRIDRWIIEPAAHYLLVVWGSKQLVSLDIRATSFGVPRGATVLVDGVEVASATIPATGEVSFGPTGLELSVGRHAVTITTDLPPQPIGGGDPRSVSIRLLGLPKVDSRPAA